MFVLRAINSLVKHILEVFDSEIHRPIGNLPSVDADGHTNRNCCGAWLYQNLTKTAFLSYCYPEKEMQKS